MGGIYTDADGRTSIEGLWACGEVASTGAHGANRLASNSLLEAVVFAARIAEDLEGMDAPSSPIAHEPTSGISRQKPDTNAIRTLRDVMSRHVGVVRDSAGLARALAHLRNFEQQKNATPELKSMAVAGMLIAAAAWQRRESRGSHERLDYPATDPKQAQRTFITLA